MRAPRLLLGLCGLASVVAGVLAVQLGSETQAVVAASAGAVPSKNCEATLSRGSTHTGGGGALVVDASLDQLSDASERIVAGTVKSFQACTDRAAGGVSTNVTLRVARHLKSPWGAGTPPEVIVNVPGGRFGGFGLRVGTSAEFSAGEQVVVFLSDDGDGLRLTSGFQGKFTVTANGEVEGTGLGAASFENSVRSAVAGTLAADEDPLGAAAGEWGEAAFVFSGPAWFPEDLPVPYYINPDEAMPAQLTPANVQAAWTNALNTWENDAGSGVSFALQGETTRDSGSDMCGPLPPDYYNDLTWGISTGHGASVLAVTLTCYALLPGTDQIVDADIEFDADAGHFRDDWRTDGSGACGSGEIDLESVTLHEAGHFIGLTHPTSNGCVNGGCPVLNASYQGVQHNLCQDDMNGVAALYPGGGPPQDTPTNTPTSVPPTNTPTNTSTPVLPTDTPTNTPPPAPPTDTPTVAPPTNTPTVAPPTDTPTVAPPTNTPTVAPPTNTPTAPAPTDTPTSAPSTETPVATPTETPVVVATETPTPIVPTATPTETAVAPTETPTFTNTPSFTPTATRTPTRTPTSEAHDKGDANCDGLVSSIDALGILQSAAGLLNALPCEAGADVNDNGRIDSLDAALVLQFAAGILDDL